MCWLSFLAFFFFFLAYGYFKSEAGGYREPVKGSQQWYDMGKHGATELDLLQGFDGMELKTS